ncbi:hypothetical protein BT96DRAFT_922057 [Gymnopus androsaceus JB14]|uniref:Uncharacterized protein n=1 Tax=Gymnopus androsaceus JB14 TaxID=1447944 RepID=A0A6A4HG22_9AGAR|nr:hypothetical protein BT96DRAFT_922057 [Gymnopus androsaceus JB14]
MIFSLNPFVPVFLLLIKLVAVDASPISPHLLSSSTKDPDMVVGYIFTVEEHAKKINEAETIIEDVPTGTEGYRHLFAEPLPPVATMLAKSSTNFWICTVTTKPNSKFMTTAMLFVPEYFHKTLTAYAKSQVEPKTKQHYDPAKTMLFFHDNHHHILLLPPLYVSPAKAAHVRARAEPKGLNLLGLKAVCEVLRTYKEPKDPFAPWNKWPIAQWPTHENYPDEASDAKTEYMQTSSGSV